MFNGIKTMQRGMAGAFRAVDVCRQRTGLPFLSMRGGCVFAWMTRVDVRCASADIQIPRCAVCRAPMQKDEPYVGTLLATAAPGLPRRKLMAIAHVECGAPVFSAAPMRTFE